jgi:hypothetical protein
VVSGAPEALGEGEGKAELNKLPWEHVTFYPHNSENLADCVCGGVKLGVGEENLAPICNQPS